MGDFFNKRLMNRHRIEVAPQVGVLHSDLEKERQEFNAQNAKEILPVTATPIASVLTTNDKKRAALAKARAAKAAKVKAK